MVAVLQSLFSDFSFGIVFFTKTSFIVFPILYASLSLSLARSRVSSGSSHLRFPEVSAHSQQPNRAQATCCSPCTGHVDTSIRLRNDPEWGCSQIKAILLALDELLFLEFGSKRGIRRHRICVTAVFTR